MSDNQPEKQKNATGKRGRGRPRVSSAEGLYETIMRGAEGPDIPVFTASQLADLHGISRPTAHKYLEKVEKMPNIRTDKLGQAKVYWFDEGINEGGTLREIKNLRDVERDVRQMEENIDELLSQLRSLEWQLLGGRGTFEPERCLRLCEATSRSMETIAKDIAELPDPYAEGE